MKELLEKYFNGIYLPTPQYPEKQHGIEKERSRLKEQLKDIIDILNLENMNISIKNIVTKMMLRFICSYRSVYSEDYCSDFNVEKKGNSYIISTPNNSLSITFDGADIIIKNDCEDLNWKVLGEDYSKCTLKINTNYSNKLIQFFKSDSSNGMCTSCEFVSLFNEDGLEISKDFDLECLEDDELISSIKGRCTRSDFFRIKLRIDDYYSIINTVGDFRSIREADIPYSYINENSSELNMIFNYSSFILLDSYRSIEKMINYYINTKRKHKYDNMFDSSDYSNKHTVDAFTTDINYIDCCFFKARIDGSYSEIIMDNIKKYMGAEQVDYKRPFIKQ